MSEPSAFTIQIRVRPRAGRRQVQVPPSGPIKVMVTEAPESGKANDGVETLLAERLGIPRRDVTIIRGKRSRDKVVEVRGIDRSLAMTRLSGD